MKLYLSSYKFGQRINKLQSMMTPGSRIGHINNSRDSTTADHKTINDIQLEEIAQLNNLGFSAEPLNLQNYFFKEIELRIKLFQLDGIWVSGGNAFVLRQAMKISGFDNLFNDLRNRQNFLYGGYSAGICILSDSLKYIQNVDNPNEFPYPESNETIWEGLNYFNFGLLPHFDSDHIESEAIGREVENCIKNKWLFKALRDGEVIIID